jgi:NADH-quinone oxidoreductase subunit M
MTDLLSLPWLEASVVLPLVGALVVSRFADPVQTLRWGVAFAGLAFFCTLVAGLAFWTGRVSDIQLRLFGTRQLALDELTAPVVPVVALLHLLIAAATAKNRLRRFSFPWLLASEAVALAVFACTDPWLLIGLLTVGTVPPVIELMNRGRSVRVYSLHMGLFVGLLVLGWSLVEAGTRDGWGAGLLLAAVLVRCGAVPAHCWLTDWFEHATFGRALLFVAPLTGVYAAIRLVLPVAPDWVLQSLGVVSLVTALYASGMAIVQREARRFFAFLFLSHASIVLVGLQAVTLLSLTGSLRLWSAAILSLGGFGLTLRALEARVGRLSLTRYHGLYDHSPALAVCFLLTGLASVGFPGTLGFVGGEMLVNGAVDASPWVGLGVVVATALNGIAVVRAYLLLFTGARHGATIPLGITGRERFAVLTLAALILGGGLVPQPALMSRHRAAEEILKARQAHLNIPAKIAAGTL